MNESHSTCAARVVVVDDDEAKRYVISRAFQTAGFTVDEGATAADALRLLQTAELLVLAIRLPDGIGFDMCRQLKSNPATTRTPVILVSDTLTDPASQVRGLDSGADAYLTDDVLPSVLIATARAILRARRAKDRVRGGAEFFDQLIGQIRDYAIFHIDVAGRMTTWNEGVRRVLGYEEAEFIGLSVDHLFTPEDIAAGVLERELRTATETGSASNDRWMLRRGGIRFWANGTTTAMRDPAGRLVGFTKVMRDHTEQKRSADALQQARSELEARVEERTRELAAALDSLEAEMTRRHSLARRLSSAQEDERRRLSRDLHDTVGQTLTALLLGLRAARDVGPLPEPVAVRLDSVQNLADELGRQLHDVAVRLRPTALDDVGLAAAARQLVDNWSIQTGVATDFQTTLPAGTRLPPEVETSLYRVLQEALNNVAKHAGARRVAVVVGRRDADAVAVVEDDGVGFNLEPAPSSTRSRRDTLGLMGMRERVEQVGGKLEIESEPGRGTTIIALIPLAAE